MTDDFRNEGRETAPKRDLSTLSWVRGEAARCSPVFGLFGVLFACVSACTPPRLANGDGNDEGETSSTDDDGHTDPPAPFDVTTCGDWLDADPSTLAWPSHRGVSAPSATCQRANGCAAFDEQAAMAGLVHRQFAPSTPDDGTCLFGQFEPNDDCEPQWYTGGVAVGDVNADGWPDLLFTRFSAPDVLYQNRGDGTFRDITVEAGLDACTFSNGAAFGDIDDDGDQDLIVSVLGGTRHRLYINDGTGVFQEEGQMRGVALEGDGPRGGQGVALGDYDLDGDLDLHIDEWLRPRHAPDPRPANFGARLLRNEGDGHFVDVTTAAGVDMVGRRETDDGVYAFASAFVDLDEDGWPELAVASDFRTSAMFWGGPDAHFQDGTETAGINEASNPMGSTFGDLEGDGDLDWFVTSIAQRASCANEPCAWLGSGNRMYRNDTMRRFVEISASLEIRDAGWGWGAALFDLDNDGDLDLAATNGWPGRDLEGSSRLVETPARLWLDTPVNGDPVFTEVAAERGFDDWGQGRGLVPVDIDRDGDLDVIVARHADTPLLFVNRGVEGHHWLEVTVHGGAGSHGEARGAVVRVQATSGGPIQTQHVGVGAHFGASGPLALHFGLGEADVVAQIRVHWPASGRTLILTDVPADTHIDLHEGDGALP